ncbi:hypothetical protein SASPL_131505 [Salvia splendens]|uniref:Uncharacterized protein n=1 Tax=Salvia splendens TaxID=180675 RepID=A0A8X8ZKN3_SALSN|nr:hypothetical protein SASPL_131505 [Salvia splendens]
MKKVGKLKKPPKVEDVAEQEKKVSNQKGKRKGSEIDEIFAANKRKRVESEKKAEAETKAKSKVAAANLKKKEKSMKSRSFEFSAGTSGPRKRTADGLAVFSEEELGIGKPDAGGTAFIDSLTETEGARLYGITGSRLQSNSNSIDLSCLCSDQFIVNMNAVLMMLIGTPRESLLKGVDLLESICIEDSKRLYMYINGDVSSSFTTCMYLRTPIFRQMIFVMSCKNKRLSFQGVGSDFGLVQDLKVSVQKIMVLNMVSLIG